uniref:Uncharacterized protein n=1 Tax=Chromera velia CCMP2878 TaxID=1169474 RepID=A0A0G4HKU1_9ALVE|eukprot:Cvel_7262.t1-p1 / transcript=Cvel_7262.t1 / gene=Cvel_7262 / organism=Chromera_velia_CCMP2878 / gene_product=hypothetical protein / transcript_product=hypothetical protein / location=Cvel_scaffold375:37641-40559(+) / protein_length=151 / sequence_SO=supercontig / SO=protein_coding / is_pseudo=false
MSAAVRSAATLRAQASCHRKALESGVSGDRLVSGELRRSCRLLSSAAPSLAVSFRNRSSFFRSPRHFNALRSLSSSSMCLTREGPSSEKRLPPRPSILKDPIGYGRWLMIRNRIPSTTSDFQKLDHKTQWRIFQTIGVCLLVVPAVNYLYL